MKIYLSGFGGGIAFHLSGGKGATLVGLEGDGEGRGETAACLTGDVLVGDMEIGDPIRGVGEEAVGGGGGGEAGWGGGGDLAVRGTLKDADLEAGSGILLTAVVDKALIPIPKFNPVFTSFLLGSLLNLITQMKNQDLE